MEHAKYKEMYELLMKDSNLSPLNIVCLYIISQKTSMQRDNCKVATSHNQHDAFILYTTIYNFSSSEMRFISRAIAWMEGKAAMGEQIQIRHNH